MKRRNLSCLLFALCFALALPGISSASQAQEQQTIAVSRSDLTTLIENNEQQRKALEQSATALTKAQTALEASQQETKALQIELSQQKEQTKTLQDQLLKLRDNSTSAEASIDAAQKSLDDTRAEFLKNEKAHERTENRLKNRIKAWQIVAAIVGGIAITK